MKDQVALRNMPFYLLVVIAIVIIINKFWWIYRIKTNRHQSCYMYWVSYSFGLFSVSKGTLYFDFSKLMTLFRMHGSIANLIIMHYLLVTWIGCVVTWLTVYHMSVLVEVFRGLMRCHVVCHKDQFRDHSVSTFSLIPWTCIMQSDFRIIFFWLVTFIFREIKAPPDSPLFQPDINSVLCLVCSKLNAAQH
jgi:hypothetical protein